MPDAISIIVAIH